MSFVRKPRPYSSGLPSLPATPPTVPKPNVPRERPRVRTPRSAWATAVTALAVLGAVVVLLVGGTGLVELLWQDAQFQSAATGVDAAAR
ncbi:hypothetical protein [Deinococcus maricopensis]|uniref:Uncharacterized protein n=1 Tax=Deinococcus maricopensis (strain DSM 21211 / LMG 22137 / NRRL B-23946 / LB-34) TaxID=709986 RepID=E8U6T0_DEIML|nr:hypothetical protein [Deinococcus maricopensis]ADV66769.1 hypothetical protein Deima_1117 [Deinococcus maricopensis DSM 21211]